MDIEGTVSAELVNFYELQVSVAPGAHETALHLLEGRDAVDKKPYSRGESFSFYLREPGVYRVKAFTRTPGGAVSTALTAAVRFTGFRDIGVPADMRPIVIAGVNRTSAAAFHILKGRKEVAAFLDPTGQLVGETFFRTPIIGDTGVPSDSVVWVPAGFHPGVKARDVEQFALETGARDALSAELFKMSVLDLYRKSRDLHEIDLVRGATHLQNFIFHHFACRLPYKVRLGEGTRLGYNGLGTVFHPESVVGRNCVIAQNVTLGSRGKPDDKPAVGDNVYIGPGAKCLGGRIGSNVVVGANAVVLKEVPDNCVVAGVPAKIISRDMGSYSGYIGVPE